MNFMFCKSKTYSCNIWCSITRYIHYKLSIPLLKSSIAKLVVDESDPFKSKTRKLNLIFIFRFVMEYLQKLDTPCPILEPYRWAKMLRLKHKVQKSSTNNNIARVLVLSSSKKIIVALEVLVLIYGLILQISFACKSFLCCRLIKKNLFQARPTGNSDQ
jgi:hypothetical protein